MAFSEARPSGSHSGWCHCRLSHVCLFTCVQEGVVSESNRAWLRWPRFYSPAIHFYSSIMVLIYSLQFLDFLSFHTLTHCYFNQFCLDPCLTTVLYYIKFIHVECMPHRLRVQSAAQSYFPNRQNKQQKKRSTVSLKSSERFKYESKFRESFSDIA